MYTVYHENVEVVLEVAGSRMAMMAHLTWPAALFSKAVN